MSEWVSDADPTGTWTAANSVNPYVADYLGYGYVDDGYVEDELWGGATEPSGTWTMV